jgi:hypothetical protein
MPGVGDQGGGVDAPADRELVPGNELVADDADNGTCDACPDEGCVAVLDQLADALITSEGSAGSDDKGDTDSGQVLGAFEPVGILLRWRSPGQPEPKEHHGAGGDV